jgi:uncharacterized protein (DUF169 family)
MSFKYKKILYGFPQNSFDADLVKELIEDIDCALDFKRKPVGVKLLFTEEEYEGIEWKEPRVPLAYCVVVEKATRGMNFKAKLEHISCDGGTTALNLEPSTDRIESGEEYFSYNLYKTPAAARRVREGVPGLYRTGAKTIGLAIAPLEKFDIIPDVIIFIINPYQAMRIQQGYLYEAGGRIELSGASMQAICAESTVQPYMTGKLNTTALCPSTRFLAKWKDEEMAIGLPYEKFKSVVEGVIATIDSTDTRKRKNEIIKRFESKNKCLNFKNL